MIEDIKLTNIDPKIIDELFDKLGYDAVLNMACNHKKIKENIELLKSFNINNIDELLLNRNDIFFEEKESLLKRFSKFNIITLSKLINEDYSVIDELYE